MSVIKDLVRATFRLGGIELVPASRLGLEAWNDIRYLASRMDVDVNTIFDVGSNDGQSTATLLRRFPKARIYGFEPQETTATKFAKRFAREPRVTAERVALGNTEGIVPFFEYKGEDKIASLSPIAPYAVRFDQNANETQVTCTTVDSYCRRAGIQEVDILKIDTEGNDHLVLEGATQMLASGRIKFVYVEFNTLEPIAGQFGGALTVMARLLHSHGFRFISSYLDYIVVENPLFSVSNALFARPSAYPRHPQP